MGIRMGLPADRGIHYPLLRRGLYALDEPYNFKSCITVSYRRTKTIIHKSVKHVKHNRVYYVCHSRPGILDTEYNLLEMVKICRDTSKNRANLPQGNWHGSCTGRNWGLQTTICRWDARSVAWGLHTNKT